MACHTWFYNKIDNMPKEHMSSIKEKLITDINGYWIMNISKENFIKEIRENIDDINNSESFTYLKEVLKDGYYENQVSKYKNYLDILHNDTDIDSFKSVVKDCYFYTEIDNISFYSLIDFGWHDNFRVYNCSEENFYDAQSLIEFLKNYNQNWIMSKESFGFNSTIENIIYEFFNTYPNGMIQFG